MVLVDTSIWIAEMRVAGTLASLIPDEDIATCPIVIQEVLQGIRIELLHRVTRSLLHSLPILDSPAPLTLFEEAAQIYRTGRTLGVTIRSSIDCLIAACALRHGVAVLHSDRDFSAIAAFTSLQEIHVPPKRVRAWPARTRE